eukprot:CAMPEP_0181100676 /NCGR_PEP_ID=MMETSP1071-20121207/13322_1 /TAXON_ID=35127 /ORGANISM="Thalassiosira sp., Strain NH16" /LENGTH=115 /DNA_ID=CAMNT_0023183425 /DNA_START=242 /DNA_END=589 /DNA_ORIENTATION=+
MSGIVNFGTAGSISPSPLTLSTKLPAAHPIPNAAPAAALAPLPDRKSNSPAAAPTVPPTSDLRTNASMWSSIPGGSCHVGWKEDAGGDDGGGDAAASVVCVGVEDSEVMVSVRFG